MLGNYGNCTFHKQALICHQIRAQGAKLVTLRSHLQPQLGAGHRSRTAVCGSQVPSNTASRLFLVGTNIPTLKRPFGLTFPFSPSVAPQRDAAGTRDCLLPTPAVTDDHGGKAQQNQLCLLGRMGSPGGKVGFEAKYYN